MAISSIHFQKATSYAIAHNFRESEERKMPKYHLPKEFHDPRGNEFWRPDRTPEQIFEEEVSKFSRKGGRIPKFENAHREAVINLNEHHTLKDLLKVKEHFERKYRFICCGIAIHRDEGHTQKIGDMGHEFPHRNYHAHINFITYANGKQQWKFSKRELAQMQTEVAEILGMERGQEFSKAKRLNHYQYRYAKQKEEEEVKRKQKSLGQEINFLREEVKKGNKWKEERKAHWSRIRQELMAEGEGKYSQKDYKAMRGMIMDFENSLDDALKAVAEYRENHAELARESQNSSEFTSRLQRTIKTLENENNGLKSEINTLKSNNQALEIQENNKNKSLEEENKSLEKENKSLKKENESLKEENNRLLRILNILNNFLIWLGFRKKESENNAVARVTQFERGISDNFMDINDQEHRDFQERTIDLAVKELHRCEDKQKEEEQALTSTKSNQYRYQNNRGGGRGR